MSLVLRGGSSFQSNQLKLLAQGDRVGLGIRITCIPLSIPTSTHPLVMHPVDKSSDALPENICDNFLNSCSFHGTYGRWECQQTTHQSDHGLLVSFRQQKLPVKYFTYSWLGKAIRATSKIKSSSLCEDLRSFKGFFKKCLLAYTRKHKCCSKDPIGVRIHRKGHQFQVIPLGELEVEVQNRTHVRSIHSF